MAWLMLLRSKLVWAFFALIGFFVRDKWRDAQARKDERLKALLKDKEDAQAVRDRVRKSRNEPVQPDGLKYRD